MCRTILLCALLLLASSQAAFGAEQDADQDNWIDPYDMLNFDHSSKTMMNKPQTDSVSQEEVSNPEEILKMAEADPPTETVVPPASGECKSENVMTAIPLFRQYVKKLLRHMDGQFPEFSAEEYHMWVKLSPADVATLQKFTDGEQGNIHDVHEILVRMLQKVTRSNVGAMGKSALWLEELIGISFYKMVQILVLVALATLIVAVEVKTTISWKKRATKLVILMFLISVPWTWYELYKAAEIRQHNVVMKDVPPECTPDDEEQNWWEFTASYFKSVFTFQEDKCLEYYEHLMIHPVLKVPPTKALAVTFVRFFVSPAKDVGKAISEFIRALLIDLPLTLYPVAIVLVSVFFFMILFMWFGYSVRLPFFLSIEPSPQYIQASGDADLQQAITDSNQQLLGKIEELQKAQQITEEKMADKLEYFEKVQKAAIEYTATSESRALCAPPTLAPSPEKMAPMNSSVRGGWGDQPEKTKPSAENTLESSGVETVQGGGINTFQSNVNNLHPSVASTRQSSPVDTLQPSAFDILQPSAVDTLQPSDIQNVATGS